jgi:hypothetical protein
MVSVPATYGAILLGGFVAAAYVSFASLWNIILTRISPFSRLSGVVTVQSFIYVKLYPTDPAWRKAIVSLI